MFSENVNAVWETSVERVVMIVKVQEIKSAIKIFWKNHSLCQTASTCRFNTSDKSRSHDWGERWGPAANAAPPNVSVWEHKVLTRQSCFERQTFILSPLENVGRRAAWDFPSGSSLQRELISCSSSSHPRAKRTAAPQRSSPSLCRSTSKTTSSLLLLEK